MCVLWRFRRMEMSASTKMPCKLIYTRAVYLAILCCVLLLSPPVSANHYNCPVELKTNHSNYCECNVLSEIFCYHLDAIPVFIQDGNEYTGIYMEKQQIKEVKQAVFFGLKVKKIVLNTNPIGDKISINAFSGLEQVLEELHLGQCGIKEPPDDLIVALDHLKVLHLWGNKIELIPDDFFANTNSLEELSLWGNRIKSVNGHTFGGLWSLKKLDLDRNRIKNLGKNVFRHLGKLESLHLGDNDISTLSSDTFQYAKSLKLLNLDNNGLAYIYDGAFNGLRGLKVLGLQQNKINYISDEMFIGLRNLTILWLQHNSLEFMWSKNFDNLKNLQELHLSYNNVETLPDRLLRSCSSLIHLFVDHNQIKTLKKCSLPRKNRLKTLSLIGNPITCDCRLSWIVDLVKKKGVTVWGNCETSQLRMVAAVTDRENYKKCTSKGEECQGQ